MYGFLLVLIVGLLVFLQARERFSLLGFEIFRFTPNTCRPNEELQSGLCYTKCRAGFRGVGPVCWAESQNVGTGRPVGLEPCPDGWKNDGLICREPIRCYSISDCFKRRKCGCRGGKLKGRLNNGGICPGPGGKQFTDKIAGLCYKQCPSNKPKRIPGMSYLCYAGGPLSYGRGVGKIPSVARLAGRYVSKDIIGI